MNNDNQEIIDIFLDTTPLYNDVIGLIIEYITYNKFQVGGIYPMYINSLDTIFFHEITHRTKCYAVIDVFGLKYRKKIRYDERCHEYIKLHDKVLLSYRVA
jgi:hypothetical protein